MHMSHCSSVSVGLEALLQMRLVVVYLCLLMFSYSFFFFFALITSLEVILSVSSL